jgi:hypothetical protein
MLASPGDESIAIDSLDGAAVAGSHGEGGLSACRTVRPSDVRPVSEAGSLRERRASRACDVRGDRRRMAWLHDVHSPSMAWRRPELMASQNAA